MGFRFVFFSGKHQCTVLLCSGVPKTCGIYMSVDTNLASAAKLRATGVAEASTRAPGYRVRRSGLWV
jgi:hypothetical protein